MAHTEEKIEWQNPVDAIQYHFTFPENPERRPGDAQLFFYVFKDFMPRNRQDLLVQQLEGAGVQPDDLLAHINEFYPNGRGLKEEDTASMAKGVGSQAYEILMQEVTRRGAKAIYAVTATGRKRMEEFLKRKGFNEIGQERGLFYKIL